MNRVLILLFVAIVALPMAGTLAGVDGGDPESENRELAPFPHWDGTWPSAAAYPDAFTAWFEDHFAFRDKSRWAARAGSSASASRRRARSSGPGPVLTTGMMAAYRLRNATPPTPREVGAWRTAPCAPTTGCTIEASRSCSRSHRINTSSSGTPAGDHPGCARQSRIDRLRRAPTGVNPSNCARPCDAKRERLLSHRYALERPRRTGGLPADHRGGERRCRPHPRPDARGLRNTEEMIPGKDLAGMIGLKRVLHEFAARAAAPAPGSRRRSARDSTHCRSRAAGHRGFRPLAASCRDFSRFIRVPARAAPVGAFQPCGLSMAERFRCQCRHRRTSGRGDPGDRRTTPLRIHRIA